MQFRFMMMGVLLLLMMDPVQGQFEYAAACIPDFYPATNNYYLCRLSILSKTTSEIEIHTITESINFTLPAGDVYEREFEREAVPILGTDSKTIRVVSSQEVQVLVYKDRNFDVNNQDVYMVPNQIRNIHEYYTSAYYKPDAYQCSSTPAYPRHFQFYLVASFDDDTSIHVEQQNGTTYDETLPAFGTFLQLTTSPDDHLAMGTRITSSKPITVVAGNLCVYNSNTDTFRDTYASSIPDIASLGQEYIVPHITSDDSDNPAGYSVGVVATEDDTIVVSNEDMTLLNAGNSTLFEYPSYEESIFVNCSKPCLVVQYTNGITNKYGLFMQNILPLEQFSTSAFFTALDTQPTSYLSLVLHGESSGDSLFLDGNSLGYLDWKPINGYTSAELAVTAGVHELVSSDDRPFAAYVYVQAKFQLGASGYALLPSESSRVTTTIPTTPTTSNTLSTQTTPATSTSTPSPTLNGTLPQHTVRVNGTAFTTDGADISPSCSVKHANNLRGKNLQMIVAVNEAIGKTICMEIGDLLLVSSAEGMNVQDNKALLVMDHTLMVQWHHVAAEVETCALEVAEYLNHLANWQQPIFPGDADCGRLDVLPPYFNTSSTVWTCDNQMDAEMDSSNSLAYASKVSEVLQTVDGSVLEPECTLAYLNEAKKKTTLMMQEISSALPTFDCGNIVTLVTNTVTLVSAGNQAYFMASFFYIPSPVASFAEFVACMIEVHNFCLHHDNWSAGSQPGDPFLPVPPGCPALEHDTDTLDDEGHRWACV